MSFFFTWFLFPIIRWDILVLLITLLLDWVLSHTVVMGKVAEFEWTKDEMLIDCQNHGFGGYRDRTNGHTSNSAES